ncbi:hypothetical protein Tco_1254509 [Tanacetum coccineum]
MEDTFLMACNFEFGSDSNLRESHLDDLSSKISFWLRCSRSRIRIINSPRRYVVPTGRVVVPTGRYVVPAGKVIIIVSPGRLSLVPTGRVLSPGRVK